MKNRIETSDEMQTVLKNSRDDLLKEFNRQYNAKRTSKHVQAVPVHHPIAQQNHVNVLEILPPLNLKVLEYDKDLATRRVKSGRRPRRDAMPRTNTPPPKKKTDYHLLPWRVCLTDSEKSFTPASERME